ncbi:hypothetical protein WDW89_22660 [Deltaproteobacteria bacterium TL4]
MTKEELFRQVRKSYKSCINWGKKNLKIECLDHQTITKDAIEQFHQLHVQAAGRETRSDHSWNAQYEMVKAQEAFVILGWLDGKLETAALFPCSSRYCYYGVSASNRDLFEKPLSHAILWEAILYAKERGCLFFETGSQLFPQQPSVAHTKELNISAFKHGFGGKTFVRLNILWQYFEV